MLILRGAPALSAFRFDKLAQKLTDIDPNFQLQHTEYVHFAKLANPLSAARESVLRWTFRVNGQRTTIGGLRNCLGPETHRQ